ncbi:mechanosensitive ion channel family protein [Granulicella sp. WH15]|uniref:mechanosensitive ion channel family protein n=1 Tax=Granulicella sp. WH15 TaxID=2602070 RepID=UPI001367923D|nr:mechanosensitive ion channel family protein [Granulicella sp. WH15]QHN03901.1 mechanosensitive ion channel family protein [Granulicella sp. WH15]
MHTLLATLFAPAPEESTLRIIEHDWHNDIMVMVRERLPKILLVVIMLLILERVVRFFVKRLNDAASKLTVVNVQRASQLRTMAAIIRGTAYSVLGFLGFLQVLNLFNIDYKPLLASAGIIGVGVGLAAQSLFKDIINGVFILVEDQYNVGDVIRAASLTGTVEDLTLRLTRLRDSDGTLHIIPNSQIATVSNLTRDYSIATLPVSVDASTNPDVVMQVLSEIAATLRGDTAFQNVLIADPVILGVDKIDGRSIVYPINLRVRPNQKDPILRELRKRIVLVFEKKGIPLGTDATMLVMKTTADSTAVHTLTGSETP